MAGRLVFCRPPAALEATGAWTQVALPGAVFDDSTDGGTDMFGTNSPVLVHPFDKNRLWVAIDYQGVWGTTDGLTWAKVSEDGSILEEGKVWGAAISLDGETLYLAVGNNFVDSAWLRVFKSTDGGVSWDPVGAAQLWQPYQVEVAPFTPGKFLCTTHGTNSSDIDAHVYETTNNGQSYAALFDTGKGNSGYAYYGEDEDTIIFVADEGGAGADATQTWRKIAGEWERVSIDDNHHNHGSHQCWVDRVNGVLYNAGRNGIKKSTNNGDTWTEVSATESAGIAKSTRFIYSSAGYASNAGNNPRLQDAPVADDDNWTSRTPPVPMTNGGRWITVTTNDAGQTKLFMPCWRAALWQYVEAAA